MNPIETLGLALGAGFSSGLNLYATVATLGFLERFGVIHLPPSLHALAHPAILGIAVVLYLWNSSRTKSPTSIRSGTQFTRSSVRPRPPFSRTAQQALHPR